MEKHNIRKKPFVEPSLKEEASLEDVTLMSGGVSSHGGSKPKKGGHGGHGGHNRGPTNQQSGHGHGRRS